MESSILSQKRKLQNLKGKNEEKEKGKESKLDKKDDRIDNKSKSVKISTKVLRIQKNKERNSFTLDPHNLCRFTRTQKTHYQQAYDEIEAGRKQSCWSWYILPTAPWIVNGIERGS